MKKIAYLILAHSDPIHLKRLIKAIDINCDFYIHIDLKSDINEFKKIIKNKNVYFIENRKSISWGGFNMVIATKELMRSALLNNNNYSHLVLLSGNDYPITTKENIYNFFMKHKDKEIIRAYSIEESNCEHCYSKVEKYYFFDHEIDESFFEKGFRLIKKYIYMLKKKINIY